MANRINKNLRWVKRQLDLAKLTDVQESEILDAFDQVETEILDVHGPLAASVDVTLTGIAESFALVLEHVSTIRVPAAYSAVPEVTNDQARYEAVRRDLATTTGQPRIVLLASGLAYFWPIGTNGDVIKFYGTTHAQTPQVEGAADPMVDAHWDDTLRFGALAHLLGGDWINKYDTEMAKQGHSAMVSLGPVHLHKKDSVRRLGF